MNSNILSYSVVGIWNNIKSSIPILKNEFCKELFGDIYNTNTGITEDGFVISLPSSRLPIQAVVIHHQRIQVIAYEIEKLLDITESVIGELNKIKDFNTSLKVIGLNTEIEISDIGMESAKWISDRFINFERLLTLFPGKDIVTKDIKIDILNSDIEKIGIIIQPRVGRSDAIYLKINYHVGQSFDEFPNKKKIKTLFSHSDKIIQKQINSLFNN